MRKCKNCGHPELSKKELYVRDIVHASKSPFGAFELAKKLRCSRAVAATALLNLYAGGVLDRVKGKGLSKYRPERWIYFKRMI